MPTLLSQYNLNQEDKEKEEKMENGVWRIMRIPFFGALNSGNFSSTTTEKSTFLDQYSGRDFENIETIEKAMGKLEVVEEAMRSSKK